MAIEEYLHALFLLTNYTTSKIEKVFLPRRQGLGYLVAYDKMDRKILKPCIKSKQKDDNYIRKLCVIEAADSEEIGKCNVIKKKKK